MHRVNTITILTPTKKVKYNRGNINYSLIYLYAILRRCCYHRSFGGTESHFLPKGQNYDGYTNMYTYVSSCVDMYVHMCMYIVCSICYLKRHVRYQIAHINKCVDRVYTYK